MASVTGVIVGAGGHGKDMLAIAQRMGLRCELVDDDPEWGWPVPEQPTPYALGVNDPHRRYEMWHRRFRRWPYALRLIDQDAQWGPSCWMGEGVVLAPRVLLLRDVKLGRHTHVNYGSTMTRTEVGDFTTIAPGVTICGDVTIGDRVFIGAGAVVKNLVTIGSGATIGAGAVVIDDVRPCETVVGVPARPTREPCEKTG